jgi:hypothetical protein
LYTLKGKHSYKVTLTDWLVMISSKPKFEMELGTMQIVSIKSGLRAKTDSGYIWNQEHQK